MATVESRGALVMARGIEEEWMPDKFGEGRCTLLEYVLDAVWTMADHIVVSFSKEPSLSLIEVLSPFGVRFVKPEGGNELDIILAGLKELQVEDCLIVSSDQPFLKPSVLYTLYEAARGSDAAIPRWKDGKIDPYTAAYHKKPFLKAAQQEGIRDIRGVIERLFDINFVDVEESLRPLDPELLTFFHANSPENLAKARELASYA